MLLSYTIGRIKTGGTVGNTHYDWLSKVILTADESSNELLEIDPSKLDLRRRIKLPGCKGAHGFVIGQNPHLAYVIGEDNASLVVLDLTAEKVIQTFSVGKGRDVLAVDSGLHLLYVSSEGGVLSDFKIDMHGLTPLCGGRLLAHAHTVSVDEETHRVCIPLQDVEGVPTLKIMLPFSKQACQNIPPECQDLHTG